MFGLDEQLVEPGDVRTFRSSDDSLAPGKSAKRPRSRPLAALDTTGRRPTLLHRPDRVLPQFVCAILPLTMISRVPT
jgi:hypothetical protein